MLYRELAHSHMSFHKCWKLVLALLAYNDILVSVGFCRGSRVEGNMSRVESRGSRVIF